VAKLEYPPKQVVLVGLKAEQRLEVYAAGGDGRMHYLRSYPVLGASGTIGPKLRSGDRQVPEGLYRISALNPNSLFHVSLRIDYPNAHDRRRAAAEGRTDLGGDIMIHGGRFSIGCLAMGDRAVEELFVLAADTGLGNLRVILSPLDLRRRSLDRLVTHARPWTPELYGQIRAALAELPGTRVAN
jgi:murein L,D-transpeptidase YafK